MEFMYGKYIGGQLHWLEAPSHVTVLVSNYVNVILKHIEIILSNLKKCSISF